MDELNINIIWRSVPIDGVIFTELQTGNRLLVQAIKIEYDSSDDLNFRVIRTNKNDGMSSEKNYTINRDAKVFHKKLPLRMVGYKWQFEITGLISNYLEIRNIEVKAEFIPTGDRA